MQHRPLEYIHMVLVDLSRKGDIKAIKKLISLGLDINCTMLSIGVLHVAAMDDDITSTMTMLMLGADPNIKTDDLYTPLHYSAETKCITKMLLTHGADPNIRNVIGETPLDIAFKKGNIDVIKLLINKTNITSDSDYDTILHNAAHSGSIELIDIALKYIDINTKNKYGHTALYTAIYKCNPKAVSYLIDKGADCDIVDVHGCSFLDYAIIVGNTDIYNSILDRVDIYDYDNRPDVNMIHMACIGKNTDIIDSLLSFGFYINKKNRNGLNPLMYCIRYGMDSLIDHLISKGATLDGMSYKKNKWILPILKKIEKEKERKSKIHIDKVLSMMVF